MRCPSRTGAALLELLLALGLVGGALVAAAPVVTQVARILTRGRSLLEGTALVGQRLAIIVPTASEQCGAGGSGQDLGRFATVDWVAAPATGGLRFEARIRDRAGRFPPESLATVRPCLP